LTLGQKSLTPEFSVLNANRYRSITPSTAAVSRASGEGGGGGAGTGVGTGDGFASGTDDDRTSGERSTGGRLVVIVEDEDDDAPVADCGAGASAGRAGGVLTGGSGGTNPRDVGDDALARSDVAFVAGAGGGAVTRADGVFARSRDPVVRGGSGFGSSALAAGGVAA
jgi:hypothetical protein